MAFLFSIFFGDAECSQRNTLINFNMIANHGCLSNNYSGSVIDTKMSADFCSRVNVYSCFTVCMFCDYPGNAWNAQLMKFMCNAIRCYGIKARVGLNDFSFAFCSRVPFIHSINILHDLMMNGWKIIKKIIAYL